MANNVEWSPAEIAPTAVEPDEVLGGTGLEPGEIGVWAGSDQANIIYGTRKAMLEWGLGFLAAVLEAEEAPEPDFSPEDLRLALEELAGHPIEMRRVDE